MSGERPRPSRGPSAIERHLETWAATVRSAEVDREPAYNIDCPCCDGSVGRDSRDRLEAVIRKGGKSGHRVAQAVKDLDSRYECATIPTDREPGGDGWWHKRQFR